MTHVSRKKISSDTLSTLEKSLISSFSNQNPEYSKKIIDTLLTNTEKLMLEKRLGIMALLNKNIEPAIISKIFSVTLQTIHRIKLEMSLPGKSPSLFKLHQSFWTVIKEILDQLPNISYAATRRKLKRLSGI